MNTAAFVFKVPDELPDEMIYGLRKAGLKMGDTLVIQGAGRQAEDERPGARSA